MIFQDTYTEILSSFGSLWKFKERGKTLEIITPFSTTNNRFVSVFLTQREDTFIVSDGGWINTSTYDNVLNIDDDCFEKLFYHYSHHYEIEETTTGGIKYYFKRTTNPKMISSLVLDVANFISGIVSASLIPFTEEKEKEEKERFAKQVNNFLSTLPNRVIKFNTEISSNIKNIKFNAVVREGVNLTLLNYVTGSSVSYFINSISKSNMIFEIADKSEVNTLIKKKVSIINNLAGGFKQDKLYPYLTQLENNSKTPPVLWSEKEKVLEYI
jgi:hypothetical protein